MLRPGHAWNRSSAGTRVQLFVAGRTSTEGSSAACIAGDDGQHSAGDVAVFDSMYAKRGRPNREHDRRADHFVARPAIVNQRRAAWDDRKVHGRVGRELHLLDDGSLSGGTVGRSTSAADR